MIAYTFKKVIKKEDGTPVEQKLLLMLNAYEDWNKMLERFDELKGAEFVGQYNPDFVPDEVPLDTVLSSEQDSKRYYIAALEESKKLSIQIEQLDKLYDVTKVYNLLSEYMYSEEKVTDCLARILEEYDNLKKNIPVLENQ